LSLGQVSVFLRYAPRRVNCDHCGIRVERVPWAAHDSWFTQPFEELVAFLCQITDKTAVTKVIGISWEAVGNVVKRIVARKFDASRLANVRRIGIDEFSYRKHHRYVTIVVDHDTRRVIWASEGNGAATLQKFFDELGPAGVARLQLATIDMAGGYMKALRQHAPHVKIVFDRFHVQSLATLAVDQVRRMLQKTMKTIKGARYALLKNPWNLTPKQRRQLASIQATNRPLYRAYLLKEALRDALAQRTASKGKRALKKWIAWAQRSRLAPFVRTAATIKQHFAGIIGYIKHRVTNAVVEGINGRMRMVARRAYGFHSAGALIAMFFLCAGGIQLNPPLP
jgi:transposase